jgi:hypothetical protein
VHSSGNRHDLDVNYAGGDIVVRLAVSQGVANRLADLRDKIYEVDQKIEDLEEELDQKMREKGNESSQFIQFRYNIGSHLIVFLKLILSHKITVIIPRKLDS